VGKKCRFVKLSDEQIIDPIENIKRDISIEEPTNT
jgi:hypothetical protein